MTLKRIIPSVEVGIHAKGIYVGIALKLDGGGATLLGLGAFFTAAAAAAAFSASFFAARSAALLFVLGAMVGAMMLLGRGLALAGAVAVSDSLAATPLTALEGPLAADLEGALFNVGFGPLLGFGGWGAAMGREAIEDARGTAYRDVVALPDACDAGRGAGGAFEGDASVWLDVARDNVGVFAAEPVRTVRRWD